LRKRFNREMCKSNKEAEIVKLYVDGSNSIEDRSKIFVAS
jgi:hypothetical protein